MSRLSTTINKFPRVFWVSNFMELFERWAWYGFYNALALYLTMSKDTGALEFTQAQKGVIMGTGTMLLYFLPLITGAISDRVGYKKVLIASFTMYVGGYFMMGTFHTFGMIFFAYIFLAVAGALFKPIISAMIAKTTNKETSSVGFGIFYMMINIGGFIGPFVSGFLYHASWHYVFLMSIIAIAINFIFVLFMFKEPHREETDDSFLQNIGIALKNIGKTLLDWRYVLFLLIMSLFWSSFNQLYYSFPVFVEDWVQLDKLAAFLHMPAGSITPVTILSMDAFFIIVFQMLVSSISAKFRPLHSMAVGILVLGGGLFLMFITRSPWWVLFGLLVFSLGEMASSPKFTEYVGRIAPADKKALYMGTSFLPIALGHFIAGWLSGEIYAVRAEKITLLKEYLTEKGIAFHDVTQTFTQSDFYHQAEKLLGMDMNQITTMLWNKDHPSQVWIMYTGMAVLSTLLLFVYDKFILRHQENNKSK